jgi:predicted transcriptional regulator
MQNKTLRRLLADKTSSQISRLLKRLRPHGLIKKVGRTYKYYLTRFGKQVITTGLNLRKLVIIPQLDSEYAQ